MVNAFMELFELESKRDLMKIFIGGVFGACVMYGFFFLYGALAWIYNGTI